MEQNKNEQTAVAYLASGCFWGTQYHLNKLPGVELTLVGYMGGTLEHPSYQQVKTGDTKHVETVKVVFDPERTNYEEILRLYFETHDFTQVGGQGPDIGSQYRSVIFYVDEKQKAMAEKYIYILTEKGYNVATAVEPATTFWIGEDYHQHYYDRKGEKPYCHIYRKIF